MWASGICLAFLSLVAAQAPLPPAFFTLTEKYPSGAKCEVTNGGACISDLNYTNNERCTFRAEAIISVSATTFDTEQDYDYVAAIGDRHRRHAVLRYDRAEQRGNGGGRDDRVVQRL